MADLTALQLSTLLAQNTDVSLQWHPHLDVIAVAFALLAGYFFGLRRLAAAFAPRGEEAVTRRQKTYFLTGVVSLVVVSSWPIHDIGEQTLFMFHMIEHLVLALVTPLLILLGTPWWLLRAVVRPILPVLAVLTRPMVALFLFNAWLGLIHAPAVVELMLTNSTFHFVSHVMVLATGFLMWWPVLGPIPDLPRLEPFLAIGYLFLQSLVPTIPASFLTLGDSALYKIYETFPRMWGISAHTDQVLAGFIMKFGAGALLWGSMTYIFFRWYRDEEKYDTPTLSVARR